MSRSYKKLSVFSDYGKRYTKWAKRQASKKVRRYKKEISNGDTYKKIYPSYDIRDFKFKTWKDEGIHPRFKVNIYKLGLRK